MRHLSPVMGFEVNVWGCQIPLQGRSDSPFNDIGPRPISLNGGPKPPSKQEAERSASNKKTKVFLSSRFCTAKEINCLLLPRTWNKNAHETANKKNNKKKRNRTKKKNKRTNTPKKKTPKDREFKRPRKSKGIEETKKN